MQRVEKRGRLCHRCRFARNHLEDPKTESGEIERRHKRGAQAVIIKPFSRAPVGVKMPASNGIPGIHETSANVFGLFE